MSALPQSDLGSTADLYERYRSRLVGFCTAQMGSREEAEDAVQDTFIYALRALRRGVVPESETAWLFTIARNVCSTRRRNGRRRARVVVTRDLDALQDVVPGLERRRDELFGLHEALASIPESQRQAILLREWQGLSYAEIAEALDLSNSAVETLLFRARRSLARALERTGKVAVRALNASPALGFVRSLLEGSAVKVVAGTLAVVAAGTIGAMSVAPRPAVVRSTAVPVVRVAPLGPRTVPVTTRQSTKRAAPVRRGPMHRHASRARLAEVAPARRVAPSTVTASAPTPAPVPVDPVPDAPQIAPPTSDATAPAPPASPSVAPPPLPEIPQPTAALPDPPLPAVPSLPPLPVSPPAISLP